VRPSRGRSIRSRVAPEREDDRLPVGVERRRDAGVAGAPKSLDGAVGKVQRGDEIVAARLTQRDVEPEEAVLLSQRDDALALGVVETVENLGDGLAD
jgi:hypothetical protein